MYGKMIMSISLAFLYIFNIYESFFRIIYAIIIEVASKLTLLRIFIIASMIHLVGYN